MKSEELKKESKKILLNQESEIISEQEAEALKGGKADKEISSDEAVEFGDGTLGGSGSSDEKKFNT